MNTKAFFLFCTIIIFSLLFSSCSTATATNTPLPTSTITPLPIPINSPTITPTSSPTATPTPLPISSENINNISEDFQIGVGDISDVSWLPDGNIAFTHSEGVSIYDSNFEFMKIIRPINKAALSDSVVSHNGKYIASLVDDQKIQVWDIESGSILHEMDTKCAQTPSETNRLAFSADDTKLFGCDENGISLWDLSDLNKIANFPILNDPERIIINSDGSYLAVASVCDVTVWNTATAKTSGELSIQCGNPVMAFTHDGSTLAVANNTNVTLYQMSSKKTLNTVTNNGTVMAVDFSSDDKTLAMGSFYFQGTSFADVVTGKSISNESQMSQPELFDLAQMDLIYYLDGRVFLYGQQTILITKNLGRRAILISIIKLLLIITVDISPLAGIRFLWPCGIYNKKQLCQVSLHMVAVLLSIQAAITS